MLGGEAWGGGATAMLSGEPWGGGATAMLRGEPWGGGAIGLGGAWGGSAAKAWPWESATSTAAFPPGVPGTGAAKGGP